MLINSGYFSLSFLYPIWGYSISILSHWSGLWAYFPSLSQLSYPDVWVWY
jgi:hypothetical protein